MSIPVATREVGKGRARKETCEPRYVVAQIEKEKGKGRGGQRAQHIHRRAMTKQGRTYEGAAALAPAQSFDPQ